MLLYKQALYVDVEIDDNEIRIQGMDGDYLSVTPEEVELYDYRWNGVSIKAQTRSRVMKRDSDIKILIGCTEEEKQLVYQTHNETQYMKGVLIRR